MTILLVLIPVTLLILAVAVALFFWAVNHQQFDDLDTPAVLPLLDTDEPPAAPSPPSEVVLDAVPGPSHPRSERRAAVSAPERPET